MDTHALHLVSHMVENPTFFAKLGKQEVQSYVAGFRNRANAGLLFKTPLPGWRAVPCVSKDVEIK